MSHRLRGATAIVTGGQPRHHLGERQSPGRRAAGRTNSVRRRQCARRGRTGFVGAARSPQAIPRRDHEPDLQGHGGERIRAREVEAVGTLIDSMFARTMSNGLEPVAQQLAIARVISDVWMSNRMAWVPRPLSASDLQNRLDLKASLWFGPRVDSAGWAAA